MAAAAPAPPVPAAAPGRAAALLGRLPSLGLGGLVLAIYLFLYAPAIVIALYSLDTSAIMSWPIDGLTTGWYGKAFHDEDLRQGLRNTVVVALASNAIALLLGVPAGFGLDRFSFPGKAVFERVLMAPFLFPGVISGLTLLTLFIDLDVKLSLRTVVIGHTTMLLGVYVVLTLVTLRRWDRSLEFAAMDLGADEIRTFFLVVLPNIRGAIFGAALLGLTVSLDEIPRTFFLTGTENTLPMVVMSRLHISITPEINAVATVVLGVSLVSLAVWSRVFRPR